MRFAAVAALLLCSVSSVITQTKPTQVKNSPSYSDEAYVIEQSDTTIQYQRDGTGEQTSYVRARIQSEAGARGFSVLTMPYASADETAQFASVRVHHADGTLTETPGTDAINMPAPVTQQAPLYSDLKQLQLPVRGLRIGDILEYRVVVQRKNPESPGQFWGDFNFVKDAVVLAQTLTLDVPADKYVKVLTPKLKPAIKENAGHRVYLWTGNQLKPTHTDQKQNDETPEAPADKKPLIAWTTFHSWQEVGDWYRNLSASRTVVNDALRAQADAITQDAKTPEEQVRALYTFVATRIRYIGVDFGIGRYQPHSAAEVLANQFGDCKDKDTLLETLLQAKGISSAPALIGVNIDMIEELPSPRLFNHVITTVNLATGRLWMDTTTEVAPFQLLLEPIRDKEALVVPQSGAATIERTPAKTPFPFVDEFEASAELNAAGELTGHVDIKYRSDKEILLRAIARNIAPAQWDKGTQYLANLLGFSGTTSDSTFASAEDTSVPMHISYAYNKKPFGDWEHLKIIPLFPVNDLPEKPEKQPANEIDLGAVRTDHSVSRIRLPENYGAELPDSVHVKTRFATYDKIYRLEGNELIAEKTLAVLQSKLPETSWKQYKKFAEDISLGEESWIQITTRTTQSAPTPNAATSKLIQEASILERARDWAGTIKKLDEVQAIAPTQPYLWSNYAYVAMQNKQTEEAKKFFERELKLHPDEGYVVYLYAGLLHTNGENTAALSLVDEFLKSHSSDKRITLLLASVQAEISVPDAIVTIRHAYEASPQDLSMWGALASYLIRNQQNDEAASIVKKHLEASREDPYVLNNGAYLLAQTKIDLPLAEQNARNALEILDRETGQASVDEANPHSFERTSLLTATWDTLGYILYEENRLDQARDYLEAAWRNAPACETGEHYALTQEALGDKKAALRTYELAVIAQGSGNSLATQRIKASITRLKNSGIASTVHSDAVQILQQERDYKVSFSSPCKSYCSATYRVQMSASSPMSVLRVGGEPKLDSAIPEIRQLKLAHLMPTHSSARLLRDAVLSCSAGAKSCDFVLMPLGGIGAERQ